MAKSFFLHIYSSKSHLNFAGKVLLTPFILWTLVIAGFLDLLDFLFTKRS